jgi:hypothetical protein
VAEPGGFVALRPAASTLEAPALGPLAVLAFLAVAVALRAQGQR